MEQLRKLLEEETLLIIYGFFQIFAYKMYFTLFSCFFNNSSKDMFKSFIIF